MTTQKAKRLFVDEFQHRYYSTLGQTTKKAKARALRPLRFRAGVLEMLATCKDAMEFRDTQVFRRLFGADEYSAPGLAPFARWKDDPDVRAEFVMAPAERSRATGDISDAIYVEIMNLLPISYADAVAIVRKANDEKRGASAEEVHAVLSSLESQHGEEPPHAVGAESEAELELDMDGFLVTAQAIFLRWHLIEHRDWPFARKALRRLLRIARKEWGVDGPHRYPPRG